MKSAALEEEEEPRQVSITMSFEDVEHFSKLLLALDEQQQNLGVTDYALGMSSLEDVFMALGEVKQETGESIEVKDVDPESPAHVTVALKGRDTSLWRGFKATFTLRLKPVQYSRQRLFMVVCLPLMMQLGGTYLAGLGAEEGDAGSNGYAVAIYPAMSFAICLLSSAQDIIADIKNKCKYVSISQGLSSRAYWLGNFFAHILLLLPAALEFIVVFMLFQPPSIPTEALPLVILTILCYPIPLTLCTYNFTQAFAGSESISKWVPTLLMTTQLLLGMLMWVATAPFVSSQTIRNIANGVHITLSALNPNYALPGMMAYLVNVDGPEQLSVAGYFATLSAVPLYLLPVTSLFCLLNLIRLDTKSYKNRPPTPTEAAAEIADEDVLLEEARCEREEEKLDAARYQALSHTYRLANTGIRPNAS